MKRIRRYHNRTYARAVHFSLGLVGLLILSTGMAVYQTPAIVLGSELNADGSVEYLCAGSGCTLMPDFHWTD